MIKILGPKLEEFKKLKPYLIGIYILLVIVSLYHINYAKKIIPGVEIGNIDVGGMTYQKAEELLTQKISEAPHNFKIKYQTQTFQITTEMIDLTYDVDSSLSRAFEVGRTGNLLIDTKDKIAGLVKTLHIDAFYDYNHDLLELLLSQIKGEVNIDAANAYFVFENGEIKTVKESTGIRVVDDALYSLVIGSFNKLDFTDKTLPIKTLNPKLTESMIAQHKETVSKISNKELEVAYQGKKWILKPEQLVSFIGFEIEEGGDIKIALNDPVFDSFMESVGMEVNELPRGKVTSLEDNKVTGFEIIKEGKTIDESVFKQNFKDALTGDQKTVNITVKDVSGPEMKEKYGIFELLGEGSSTYNGSASARVHNLTLAAERTNGVLVPPGGIYSLNNSIGEIDSSTGYSTAYIIKGDRTILGAGGGVCQTSTTLFRAVLNSGLPVVTRYAHAYRVSYYEQDNAVGFDAAIFQPSWDFQFKNDTKAYVLVQAYPDPDNYSLSFKIYGTSDGRQVEITEPVVTNQTPPPAALYQDDPSLAKGVVKQVDFAAWGATSNFTRTVKTSGGEVLFNETYTSKYQPWRAIYLVGTKE